MSENSDTNVSVSKKHEHRVEKARQKYEKKIELFEVRSERVKDFLEANDSRLERFRERNDEQLRKKREKFDENLNSRREKIRKEYVKGDSAKEEKLQKAIKRTDEYIQKRRESQDSRRINHRESVEKRRKLHDERYENRYNNARERELRKLRAIEEDEQDKMAAKRFKIILYSGCTLFVVIVAIEFLAPGTTLKKHNIIDDTPIAETLGLSTKEYDSLDMSEEELLWNLLNDHFQGNRNAVLGVMCNLMAESNITAGNLEDFNNGLWGIDDETYTEKVNRETIGQKDFAESRYKDSSNGYYNEYDQWVNSDGGYGYAQYTSYVKKNELYEYARKWFGKGGQGENYKFNIADPKMQAHFIIHMLESEEYADMDSALKESGSVVDACYIWLKQYEIPYDPYNDGYYTLAFERSDTANSIEARCTENSTEDTFEYDY